MWQIAVIWILAATLGIYASGAISGGHLNPAVTLSFALARPSVFSFGKVVPYWIAQIFGGFIATIVNLCIFVQAVSLFEKKQGIVRGTPESIGSAAAFSDYWSLSDYVASGFHAFFLEALGTAFLVFIVFMATHPKNSVPSGAVAPCVGVAIGCMVTLLGPLTNAGINPARDLGPRIALSFAGWGMASFKNWWVYSVGPLIGGPIGAFLVEKLLMA
jgi:MIP family channel proteins